MLKQKLKTKRIILASKSPRRHELLKSLQIPFDIITSSMEEIYPESLKKHEITDYLSKLKAGAFKNKLKNNDILITSDTIVWHNNSALGKPKTTKEAIKMLYQLSGSKHEVITSICITSVKKQTILNSYSSVFFKTLENDEINFYVNNFNPLDKAGAYGIQDWIGKIGIEKIEGSYYNIMGLPTDLIYKSLIEF